MKTKTFTSFTENGLDNKIAAFLASTDIEAVSYTHLTLPTIA